PNWLTTRASRTLNELIGSLCTDCGIGSKITLVYQKEASVRHRKNLLANSITRKPSSFDNPTSVSVVAVGDDPRNDIAEVIISTTKANCDLLRARLDRGAFTLSPEPLPRTPAPAPKNPPAPEFDELAYAVFLSDVRVCGGTITRATAEIRAKGFFDGQTAIIEATVAAGYLSTHNGTYTITPAGAALLEAANTTTVSVDSTKPEPSQFEQLKATVQALRARCAELEAEESKVKEFRAQLSYDLDNAREAQKSAELNLETMKMRLEKATTEAQTARSRVLDLEKLARDIPTNTALIQTERDLKAALEAYNELTAL
ncbi:MAG: hypothetical protein J0L73_28485, partial [Verrucomicrobia bacterium]|nr:hypothetical protein [Verrucomicrobiota bacterium]